MLALVSILSMAAQFGMPKLVVRETAKAHVNKEWGLMRGVWRWASMLSGSFSVGLAAIAIALTLIWGDAFPEMYLGTFFFGLILVQLITFEKLRGAALQGLRHVVFGHLFESVLRPALLIILILMFCWWGASDFTPLQAMRLHVVAAGIAFFIGAWVLYAYRPVQLCSLPAPVYESRVWFMSIWPLALVAGMQQLNQSTGTLMLGIFETPEDVGIYRVAAQGAMLVGFGLQTVNMFIAPYIARLHAQEDYKRLQRLVTISTRVSFFIALPIVLVWACWGDGIIHFIFGEDYVGAYLPLVILAFGQLINVLFGPVGILLNMTGHERDTMRGLTMAAVLNVLLSLTLIPMFGINGAAVASAITLVAWNVLLWRTVRLKLGINIIGGLFVRT